MRNNRDPFDAFSGKFTPLVDEFISSFFGNKIKNARHLFIKNIYFMLREYCTRPGKRIRPIILLNAYSGYKAGRKNFGGIIKLAAAIEIMHSFLLIQDDIIDKSELRRGAKALHVLCREKFKRSSHNSNIGSDMAVIMADVLLANSIEIIGESAISPRMKNEFLKIFSSTYEMTAFGQMLDILHSLPKNFSFHENVALEISDLKTARYTVYYPMEMGYILSGRCGKGEMKSIAGFALPLGMAFQVRDDILGVYGREDKTGKPKESDIVEGKITLLIHNTINNLKGKARNDFIGFFSKPKKKKSDISFLREMIDKTGALEMSLDFHASLIKKAEKKLAFLKVNRESLEVLMGVIERIKTINI